MIRFVRTLTISLRVPKRVIFPCCGKMRHQTQTSQVVADLAKTVGH